MMLEHVGAPKAGAAIYQAIETVLSNRGAPLTPDMGGNATTSELGDAIVEAIG
jgi:tartrate dehydrogenase/decarboxylase/D-malate dehydrogenase